MNHADQWSTCNCNGHLRWDKVPVKSGWDCGSSRTLPMDAPDPITRYTSCYWCDRTPDKSDEQVQPFSDFPDTWVCKFCYLAYRESHPFQKRA